MALWLIGITTGVVRGALAVTYEIAHCPAIVVPPPLVPNSGAKTAFHAVVTAVMYVELIVLVVAS